MARGFRRQSAGEVDPRPLVEEYLQETRSFPALRSEERVPPSLPLVVVMVPCYNEQETLASVIRRIPRQIAGVAEVKVLVVDDGSEDDSRGEAERAGADFVLRHPANRGLGRTFRDGMEAALRMGADIIVNIDADGQYMPEEIPRLLSPLVERRADVVLGDRQVDRVSHMPLSRRWGNQLASWVTRRLSGLDVQDSQTGFRAFTGEAALRLTLEGDYTYTQEMLVQAAYRGLAVEEVPVTFRRRESGTSRLIRSAWEYAGRSGVILLRTYRDHDPVMVFTLLGLLFFAAGGVAGGRVLVHFSQTGAVSPLLPSAIFAAVMGVVGLQVVLFGLLADTMRSHRQVSEEVLIRLRRAAWEQAKMFRETERQPLPGRR